LISASMFGCFSSITSTSRSPRAKLRIVPASNGNGIPILSRRIPHARISSSLAIPSRANASRTSR
jgi:hypothetical protein